MSQFYFSTREVQPEKKLNFSAFSRGGQKNYSVEDQNKKRMTEIAEPFVPKDEFTRIPFDPNIRHRMDDVDNTLIYRSLIYKEPDVEP